MVEGGFNTCPGAAIGWIPTKINGNLSLHRPISVSLGGSSSLGDTHNYLECVTGTKTQWMTRECIRDFSTSAIPHHDQGVWVYSSRRLASIVIKAGSVAAGRCGAWSRSWALASRTGSREQRKQTRTVGVCKLLIPASSGTLFASSKVTPPKRSQTVPPTGDQALKRCRLWAHCVQTPTGSHKFPSEEVKHLGRLSSGLSGPDSLKHYWPRETQQG